MFGSQDSSNSVEGLGSVEPVTKTSDAARGTSLARGPAWIVGSVLSAFGLAMFFRSSGTPLSTIGFPDGAAVGDTFLGIETNAWTAWGTTAAGLLVLMGAAQHALAKTMSLLAGAALGAAAILAIIEGDVLGLAAANTWTIVGWGAAAGILLVTALLPRMAAGDRGVERDLVAEGDQARQREQDVTGAVPRRGLSPEVTPATNVRGHSDGRGGSTFDAPVTSAAPTAERGVAPGAARSQPLQRTYKENLGSVTDDELEAARKARAAEDARRR